MLIPRAAAVVVDAGKVLVIKRYLRLDRAGDTCVRCEASNWPGPDCKGHQYAPEAGTSFASRFHQALGVAVSGQLGSMTKLADDVLERVGGRLWDGFLLTASLPAQ
jgi:hypothetical protein